MVSFVGVLVALVSLAGLALGLFMAVDRRTRGPGIMFAVWWAPALAAAIGIFMRDPVTFLVGLICFVVAGATLHLERASVRKASKARRFPSDSERTTSQMIRTKDNAGKRTAS